MKLPGLLLLLGLLALAAGSAPGVRVTFSPLTKTAYLAALKTAVVTKPATTFPLKKERGRIVIPTAKGPVIFQDITAEMSADTHEQFDYAGYDSQLKYHLVKCVVDGGYWGRHLSHLVGENGQHLVLPPILVYAPDMHQLVAATDGRDAGHSSEGIHLYRLKNNRWQQAWKLEFAEEAATWSNKEIHWLSNSTLLLKKCVWNAKGPSTFTYAKLTIQS